MKLNSCNVLLTGGSKGIGLAIAHELCARGANLFIVARGLPDLQSAQQQLRQQFPELTIEIASCDVADFASVTATVETALQTMGGLDGVINNAGFATPQYFEEISVAQFKRVMEVDYLGAVHMSKAVLGHLKPGGFISFTSSVAGYVGTFGYTSYSPAKFALIGFAESLEQELLSRKVQVSVLCPPDTQTPGFEIENQTKPFETHEMSKSASLMTSEDVAKRFVDKLVKGKFLITVNFESGFIRWLKGVAPDFSRWIMHGMVRKVQKLKPSRSIAAK